LRQLSVSRLKQGDVLGRTIYANDGRVLLGRGTERSYTDGHPDIQVSFSTM